MSDDWYGLNCATGQTCEMGPHGPDGFVQCRYCGAEPPENAGQMRSIDEPPTQESTSLEQRVAALEALVACPQCGGHGTITTICDELDECPSCHGTKINPVLTGYA